MQTGLDQTTAFQASVDVQDECVLNAVGQAFTDAGEAMPGLPSAPAVPDTTDAQQFMDDLSDAISGLTDPLGVLGGIIEIEFDVDGLPTLISWPD